MTKNRKLIILLVVLMISIILFMVIKGILAFNYDRQATSNVFTIGNVKIKITEGAEWDAANANNTVPSFAQNKTPGSTIPKAPQIQNTGVNPAYVYMKVYVPIYDREELFSYTLNANSGWTKRTEVFHTNDGKYNVYVYEYDTALAPNATTPALFNSVTLTEFSAEDVIDMGTTNTKIIIKGFAIQSENGITKSSNEMTAKMLNTVANSETVGLIQRQWVKYAVQVYGINQDEDGNGATLGLTFGPATGADYNNKYVTHDYDENGNLVKLTYTVGNDTPERTTLNVTRTTSAEREQYGKKLHDMTWAEIAAEPNKEVFTDSMLCGDTKCVKLDLNSTIKNTSYTQNANGDGTSVLYNIINSNYRKWNDSNNNDKADKSYAGSRIRATLIGNNVDTKVEYAGTGLLDSSTCLYSCIERSLKNKITAKKVKYATGTTYTAGNYQQNIVTDKIWLFSEIELNGSANYSGREGTEGTAYQKFTNSASSATSRVCSTENNITNIWWLRSPILSFATDTAVVDASGDLTFSGRANNTWGVNFGFCIK